MASKTWQRQGKDSPLGPPNRNAALFTPWILPSDTCVGLLTCRNAEVSTQVIWNFSVWENYHFSIYLFIQSLIWVWTYRYLFYIFCYNPALFYLICQTVLALIVGSSFSGLPCPFDMSPLVCQCVCLALPCVRH